ncbi:hypothetical protein ABGB19_00105 [Mycobacterium sp. B14F4]|uniref:hypothetical protein n=1 Tax=Mycobacterium sp. B14F4 TaxID=3153565 RepID=UPI00325C4C1C
MRIRGPLVTLGAVGALAVGLWLGNVSQEQAPAPRPAAEAVAADSTAAPSSPIAPTPAVPHTRAFPARAEYVGTVPTKVAPIALEISVDGTTATAYACDNVGIETWLRGSAADGTLTLTNKDATSRLEGRLQGRDVVGTLSVGDKLWQFEATPAQDGSDA